MDRLKVFVDFVLPDPAIAMLREGTAGHELLFPEVLAASVLAKAARDPRFLEADIAFGQPDTSGIAESTRLKWVHISSSGITRYDTPEFRNLMRQKGIPLTNSASVYDDACAVHALSFMLAQARNLPKGLRTRTPGGSPEWHDLRETSSTLEGDTVVILGYGAIGRRLVELLRPFRVNVVGFRRSVRGDEGVPMVSGDGLPGALAESDHVMNILPESVETRHFFDAVRFSQLKRGAILYNIGRGSTVDQSALAAALQSGQLRAAWLDVTDPEPLPDNHPLWREPNCFITPHVAGGHRGEAITQVRHFLANFNRFIRGEPLRDRVM